MELPIAVPRNDWLELQPDRHWLRALRAVLGAAGAILLVLGLVGWPRLKSTALSYDLLRLRHEVRDLERIEARLAVELEIQRSPVRLAEQATDLGLQPPALAATFAAPYAPPEPPPTDDTAATVATDADAAVVTVAEAVE